MNTTTPSTQEVEDWTAPMPTNFAADGTPRLRADDRRPVDFGNWVLGPRRAYHLKVR